MSAEDIKAILVDLGWEVEIISRSDVPDLGEAKEGGLLKCVDGRASDDERMYGPKMLGGLYAIASMRGVTKAEDLGAIVQEIKDAGFTPSVHGDDHATPPSPMGCGYFKLWTQGRLGDDVAKPEFSGEEGRDAVLAAGGSYEVLTGDHKEEFTLINLIDGTTRAPNDDQQRFVVDAWALGKFDLDAVRYVHLAAQTVKELGGALKAKIIAE